MLRKSPWILFPLILVVISCAGFGSSGNTAGSYIFSADAPVWVVSVSAEFPQERYVAATGFASSREMAQENALAALTAFFGQTVQVDTVVASSYQQAITNGVMDGWLDTVEMRSSVRTFALADELFGVEIRDVWLDSRGIYYAVAVMEKARAIPLYNELITANNNVINNLLNMTPNEKYSLNGVIRYRFAAAVADINASYRDIVVLLGDRSSNAIATGDLFRLEAQNIIREIPIGINVSNDRHERIYNAFARNFAAHGFEAATGDVRYVFNVNVNLTPVDLPANPNPFVRLEIAANLYDTTLGLVLLPYTFNTREGAINRSEAENRSILAAERNINEEFGRMLSDYLNSLIPRN